MWLDFFHAYKFRSRAVIEFGDPIDIHPNETEAYRAGGIEKRNAIESLLDTIYEGLAAVTELSPTMMRSCLFTLRMLDNPFIKRLSLSLVVEFNRPNTRTTHELSSSEVGHRLQEKLRALGIKRPSD